MLIKNLFFIFFIFFVTACNTQEPKLNKTTQYVKSRDIPIKDYQGIMALDTTKTKVRYVPEEVEHTYPTKNKKINYDCSKACYNYKKCASYTKGITQQGRNDAFRTCFDACQQWSKTTINCMSNCKINSISDCICPTQCGLNEYNTKFPALTGTI